MAKPKTKTQASTSRSSGNKADASVKQRKRKSSVSNPDKSAKRSKSSEESVPKKPKQTRSTVKKERPAAEKDDKKIHPQSSLSNKDTKFVGAHTSISGGLYKAVLEAVDIGAKAFGMFLKSQRQWNSKPMDDKAAERFVETYREYGYAPNMIVPHGSYLMNCGSPNQETLQKSKEMLVDELQRCEKLGLSIFNFHPGSTCGEISVEKCLASIAKCIDYAHSKTKYVITVIENMSCQGNTVGGTFEELRGIIDRVKNKARMGVCLDTCHAFAAGFNIATEEGYEKMMSDFDHIVGLKYLKAIHLNDSKGACGCHLDRHENIGKGKLGIQTFKRIMNDPRLNFIPFVLETPYGEWDKEIKKLYKLCD